MRSIVVLLLSSLLFGTAPAVGALPLGAGTKEIFSYRGQKYDAERLSPAAKQSLYDMRREYWERYEAFVDEVILDLHVEELVKKSGKARLVIEDELFHASEPSDKEVADWYDGNRNRLPPGYKLEQIAGDIRTLLKGEQKKKKRDELIAKLKRDGKAKMAFEEPLAPKHAIASDGYPAKGAAKAKVTIVEFADYQCPHCQAAGDVLAKLVTKYADQVRLVFMDFPLNQSGISLVVAHGAVCADEQGRFWDYHAAAFKDQGELTADSPGKLATTLKLDVDKFKACMATDKPAQRVAKAKAEGERVGVDATPTIYLNGQHVRGYEEAELEREIAKAIAGAAK